MTYEARKISNFILTDFDPERYNLSNLRINKLLFLIHGWSLAKSNRGLVKNHFEAWRLGPVVRVVYDTFKKFGDENIKTLAEHLDYETGKIIPIPFDDISTEDRTSIRNVVIHYADFTTPALVGMTHEQGGPWETVVKSFESKRSPDGAAA